MTTRRLILLAVLVMPVAVWARWHGSPEAAGPFFHPRPDALEYAASAQAIEQTGRFYLQVGPVQVRPRYPPGWPLMLAGALRCGVDATDLWRVTGVFGALLAWLLAVVASSTTAALSSQERGGIAHRFAPLAAGLLAGWIWSLAPIAAGVGGTLLSDEPAALAAVAALVFTGTGLLLAPSARALVLSSLGGLFIGLAAAIRPIAAMLLVPPLAVLLALAVRRAGSRPLLPRAGAWLLGTAVFPAAVLILLHRSGLPLAQWSGYAFWLPERYGRLSDTFAFRYAFWPDDSFSLGEGGEPLSHLGLAVRVLLGLPGLRIHHYLGVLWPVLGWLATVPLFVAAWSPHPHRALAPWLAVALALWVGAHVAVFSLYFYPASRFYLAPLALCTVLLASACGLGLARPGVRFPALTGALATLILALTVQGWIEMRREPLPPEWDERTRTRFARWRDRSDEERAGRIVPFDPVVAQALGLLTPEVVESVHAWGELPPTVHVRRLRALGVLPPEPVR